MDTAQRDSLLTDMITRRQWGVCSVLLEQGVIVQSCLDALPVFMDMSQWTLVARVMEFIVDDDIKQQVMQRAMESREGSVVWRCLRALQHYHPSVEERKKLFQQAMYRGMWQLVKPLVEEKDSTGIRHRDIALLKSIEQRQWDVVDYCQLHGANIDMKDRHGESPLNRETRQKDWKAVRDLVVKGADTNWLDRHGSCLLNAVIDHKRRETARLVIEYHGNIHRLCRDGDNKLCILLERLISAHQGDLLHHSLMWCCDQHKGVPNGETTLHAIALGWSPEQLYYQIVRGVNPLRLTNAGQSVLL
jgi:hypothetical protein